MSERGRLVVISGPSGSGKSTICDRLIEREGFERVVTCTTRPPRPGERHGVDYQFLDREEFERAIREGRFVEWARVHDRLYGTPRDALERALEEGRTVLLNIDVQGARQVAASGIGPRVEVFVVAPDLETLRRRLERRGTDGPEEIERRIEAARAELRERDRYHHVVVNEDVEEAVSEVLRIVRGARERAGQPPPRG